MSGMKEYNIAFSGLKRGKHEFSYRIEKAFFDLFDYENMQQPDFTVKLDFVKFQNFMELHFDIEGTHTLTCDLSNEPYSDKLHTEMDLVVKFGEVYDDDNDEILVIPYDAYELNVAQYIYEAIILAIPLKKVHPGVLDGSLHSDTLDKLKEYQIRKHEGVDPRWNKLNEILNNKDHGTS